MSLAQEHLWNIIISKQTTDCNKRRREVCRLTSSSGVISGFWSCGIRNIGHNISHEALRERIPLPSDCISSSHWITLRWLKSFRFITKPQLWIFKRHVSVIPPVAIRISRIAFGLCSRHVNLVATTNMPTQQETYNFTCCVISLTLAKSFRDVQNIE